MSQELLVKCLRCCLIINALFMKMHFMRSHAERDIPLLRESRLQCIYPRPDCCLFNSLVDTVKEELVKEYDEFIVKIIQLYYDDDYEIYQEIKEEDITKQVCV